jgi:hypothetical protein
MQRKYGSRIAAAVTLLAFAVAACSATTTYRYRVPLVGPDGPAAQACVKQCLVDHADRSRRLECWRRCPGAEVAKDRTCGPADQAPAAACEEYERTSAAGAGRILGGVLLVATVIGVVILLAALSDVKPGEE